MGPNGTGDKLIRIVMDVRVGPAQWASTKNMSTFYSNCFRTAVDATGYGGNSDDIYTPKDDEQWAKVEDKILNGGGDNPSTKYQLINNKYVINYSGDSRMDVENPAPMWLMYEVPVVEDFSIDEDMNIYVNMIAGMTGGSGQSAAQNGMPIIGMDGRVYFTIKNSDYIEEISLLDPSDAEKNVRYGTDFSSLDLPKTLSAISEDAESFEVSDITWSSEPEYDGNTSGTYVFTPILPEKYVLSNEAVLPTITVNVKEKTSSGGSGGGGGSSAKPDDGKGETVTNPDGSVTTTTKDETTGSVTETTEYKDGSKFTQITSADGKVQREAVVSEEAVKTAKDGGNPVNVAMPEAEAEKDTAKAPELTIDLPCEEAVVEIPVADIKPGIVAVIVEEDGTEAVVKISEVTEQGLVFSVRDGQKVKIIDNSKIFSDCTDHWAADAIDFAAARELFNGTGANTFSPNRPMTRGMLMTVLARMNDVDTEGGSTWYEKGLLWAVEQGISDGTNPEQKISREQLVTMLYRAAGRPEISGDLGSFSDRAAVSSYAHDAMVWAISQGLIEGTDENQLLPGSDATRAQVATILMRYCAMLLK